MKKSLMAIAFSVLFFYALSAQATLTLTPDLCGDSGVDGCWYGNETSNSEILTIIEGITELDPFLELYKQNVGESSDTGPYAGSYKTTFSNTSTDPSNATIEYESGSSIVCPECFLLVKDGGQIPAWYLFDLSYPFLQGEAPGTPWTGAPWDGMETIELEGFWPGGGAISHVAIYGTPVPAAAWLLGTGLVGMLFIRRKKR